MNWNREKAKKKFCNLKKQINHGGFLIERNRDLWHHAHHKMPKQIIVLKLNYGERKE